MNVFAVNYILRLSETQWVLNTVSKLHFKWLRDYFVIIFLYFVHDMFPNKENNSLNSTFYFKNTQIFFSLEICIIIWDGWQISGFKFPKECLM